MTRARDVANLIGSGNYSSTTFTATAGQTAFTISHTQGFVQVFMNGLLLDETVDYTSNGSAVTLTSGAAAGDEIEVVAYNTFSVGDALNQAAADTRYVNATGDTVTGQLTVDTATSANLTVDSGVYGGIQFKVTGTNTGYVTSYTDGAGNEAMYIGGADTVNLHTGTNHALTGGTTRIGIDSSGRVTMPYQPVFQANTLSTGATGNYLTFTSTRINVGNHYSTSNGRFTAPVAGTYLFGWTNIGNTTNTTYRYYLRKNGADIGDIHLRQDNNASGVEYATNATMTIPLSCAVNDYIQIYYYADDGTTSSYTSADYPLFWGYLIG